MRCRACARTVTPSQTKDFCGLNFCKRCYDALELKNLEKKELQGYFLSLSTEDTTQLVEALVTIASKFHKREVDTILEECIKAIGGDILPPTDIFTFLLATKAVQESQGSQPLTSVGRLALLSVASKLASELMEARYGVPSLDENLSTYDLLKQGSELAKIGYETCAESLDQLEPSEYAEAIRRHLQGFVFMFELMFTTEEVNLSTVEEGIWMEFGEEVEKILLDTLGSEHVFHGWDELKDTFENLKPHFLENGIFLDISEEEYPGEIYLLVGEGEAFLTTQWEEIKKEVSSRDFDAFIDSLGEVPSFVYERAAGGVPPFQEFIEEALSENPENVDLILLYADLLNEQENPQEALHFLEKKSSDVPDPELLIELADLFNETDQPERALATYEKAAEMDPENWDILVFMGQTYEAMENVKKAGECYQRALDICPQNPVLVNLVIRTEIEAAIDDINQFISQEEYKRALKIIDRYFDPFDITPFHYYKGIVLSRMGESREALSLLTDYLDLYPEDEEGWLEKAGIYLELGQFAAAARCFKRCSMLDPYDIEPLVWEAMCHKKLGRSRFYKRCINAAKKIDPEGTKALLKELKFL
ncbi:MAG: hypothetical protein AYK19_17330 [Theionarchaea archaeon DG-70-1]|nr:MAG: hypothetical protein AYK19_17330 [Theionarchaea archaeon DG-70-1]